MKKILYFINIDWFFISHFLPVGLEAIKRGYEVHIGCTITDKKEYLENLGFIVHEIPIRQSKTTIKSEFQTIKEIYKTIKTTNPQILEFFTIKPVLYGGIISRFFSIPRKVFYITGLGYVFTLKGFKGLIVRNLAQGLYKLALKGKNNFVITENNNDKELISKLNVIQDVQIKVIKGAGVDLRKYKYVVASNANIKVVMACRLLKDKGVFEFIEAAKIIKKKFNSVIFELYGDIDSNNPTSLTIDDLANIKKENIVQFKGFSKTIADEFQNANIVVLSSYREGLPKVLVEAAACGRAVVTTDSPGCKDAIKPNITGLLCEVKNAHSLAKQLEKLISDETLRNKMGEEARKFAEDEFDINKIIEKHFLTYQV